MNDVRYMLEQWLHSLGNDFFSFGECELKNCHRMQQRRGINECEGRKMNDGCAELFNGNNDHVIKV